jgi:hypothetical protein
MAQNLHYIYYTEEDKMSWIVEYTMVVKGETHNMARFFSTRDAARYRIARIKACAANDPDVSHVSYNLRKSTERERRENNVARRKAGLKNVS